MVIAAQYQMASKKGCFMGKLPSVICRQYITNDLNKAFLDKHYELLSFGYVKESKDLLNEFLQISGNGASTKRICDRFNLEAVGMSMNEDSVYIHVVPIKEKVELYSEFKDKQHLICIGD